MPEKAQKNKESNARKKKVTMKDIAEQLGLSINAVSLALNDRPGVGDATRKLVLDTAEQMGYLDQSSKYIQTYSNKNICVLLKHRFFRDFRFYGRILLGIEEEAKKSGYDVIINSYEEDEIPACVEGHKVSGIIVVGKINDSFLIRLREYGIPIVLADHVSGKIDMDCVLSDNKRGAYKMAMYLLEQGFTKIGYVGDLEYTPSTRERFIGLQEAVRQFFSKSMDESIDYLKRFSALNFHEEFVINREADKVYEAFQEIEEKPEVLFCSNDELAVFLMKTLQNNGYSVPADIAITGFDDIELCKMITPTLTTVHVQKKMMGIKAMQILLRRITKPREDAEQLVLNVEIIKRDSARKEEV